MEVSLSPYLNIEPKYSVFKYKCIIYLFARGSTSLLKAKLISPNQVLIIKFNFPSVCCAIFYLNKLSRGDAKNTVTSDFFFQLF